MSADARETVEKLREVIRHANTGAALTGWHIERIEEAASALDAQGATTGEKCINCGEPSSTGGGYEIGTEEHGGIAGPFCASCHDEIEEQKNHDREHSAPYSHRPADSSRGRHTSGYRCY